MEAAGQARSGGPRRGRGRRPHSPVSPSRPLPAHLGLPAPPGPPDAQPSARGVPASLPTGPCGTGHLSLLPAGLDDTLASRTGRTLSPSSGLSLQRQSVNPHPQLWPQDGAQHSVALLHPLPVPVLPLVLPPLCPWQREPSSGRGGPRPVVRPDSFQHTTCLPLAAAAQRAPGT